MNTSNNTQKEVTKEVMCIVSTLCFQHLLLVQHINISMITVVWSIILSLNNSDSITYYILTILFALGSKISYTDDIFNLKTT